MKLIGSYILLLAIVVQLFWTSGYLVDYYINSDVYKESCQNKDKPELNCDGKCILAQKMKKNNAGEERESFWPPISFEYIYKAQRIHFKSMYLLQSHSFVWREMHRLEIEMDIFKPPV